MYSRNHVMCTQGVIDCVLKDPCDLLTRSHVICTQGVIGGIHRESCNGF